MKTKVSAFKTFPEFSELRLNDKDRYNDLVKDYPAISGISFPELAVWWSSIDPCKLAMLNGNLVISYWLPGHEEYSGIALIGTNQVDESICEIFDHLKSTGRKPRLAHVPQFVIECIKYPEMFSIGAMQKYDECIISTKKLASLKTMPKPKAEYVEQFLKKTHPEELVVKSLDLTKVGNQELLIDAAKKWKTGTFNFIAEHESQCLEQSIWYADDLGLKSVCLFFNGKLHSYLLYQVAADPTFGIINYGRFSYENPHMFEFAVYEYAKWFVANGIEHLNIQDDLGDAMLRAVKVGLAPENYFRKYTIERNSINA